MGYDVIIPNENNNKNTQKEIAARRNVTSSPVDYIYYVRHRSSLYYVCPSSYIGSTRVYSEGGRERETARQPGRQIESEETETLKAEYLPVLLCE